MYLKVIYVSLRSGGESERPVERGVPARLRGARGGGTGTPNHPPGAEIQSGFTYLSGHPGKNQRGPSPGESSEMT